MASETLPLYDSLDEETMRCYNEFALASTIYFGLKESACSEQSSRMTAMDSASKNAGTYRPMLEQKYIYLVSLE